MKKFLITILAVVFAFTNTMAQSSESVYALNKQGTVAKYSMTYGGKLTGYLKVTSKEVTGNDENGTITILEEILNKKGKPLKSASWIGLGDGLLLQIDIKDGEYYMTQDFTLASMPGDERQGYLLKIKNNLKVGDEIEGSTIDCLIKFMGVKCRNSLTYSNFKVESEEDLVTPAGTIHCLKVTGNVSGKFQKMDINDNQTWYIAPNIGIVKQISNYMGEKNSVIIELCEITGL